MSEKTFNTRIQLKHDKEAKWLEAKTFVPKRGELIIYEVDTNHNAPRIKIGDGTTIVSNLPFASNKEEIMAALEALDISDPKASGTATDFIATIEQTDGLITATKKSIPTANGTTAGITVVHPAASCTTYTSDTGAVTPAAVKKAVETFGVLNTGDTMSGGITFSNPNATSQKDHPLLQWNAISANTPRIGYASDQSDGTFIIGSLKGTTYQSGLAIGGGSGNLLWKGVRVATTDDLPSNVSTSTAGLMTANDKKKLDGITDSADSVSFVQSATSGNKVGTITINDVDTVLYSPTQSSVSGNAGTATTLKTARAIDGVNFNGSTAITHYGTCSTAAATAAKTVSLTNFTLVTGARITVKFTVTNTAASPTLNVNSTGAKAIMYRGSAISKGYLAANRVYEFIYDGTDWELVGDINTDTNTKVTAVGNHYDPAADSSAALSADASGTTAATWGTTSLVTGVNLQRDAKGHVTGVTVDSIKMPANPNSDTDTKNTAGSTDTSSKIYLIGATSQAANPQTYSHGEVYVGTDHHLYSNSTQVVNLSDTQALTNKTYNGYTLAAACAKGVTTSVASGNTNLVTSGGVYTALGSYLPLKGGTMTGNITMGTNKISLGSKTILDGSAEQLTCSTACFVPNGWAFFDIKSKDQTLTRSSWQISNDNQLFFRSYRTTDTSNYEAYYLPAPTATGTSNVNYNILTSKGGATSGLLYSSSSVAITSTGFRNIKVITPGTTVTAGSTAITTGEIWLRYEE